MLHANTCWVEWFISKVRKMRMCSFSRYCKLHHSKEDEKAGIDCLDSDSCSLIQAILWSHSFWLMKIHRTAWNILGCRLRPVAKSIKNFQAPGQVHRLIYLFFDQIVDSNPNVRLYCLYSLYSWEFKKPHNDILFLHKHITQTFLIYSPGDLTV